jgi:hypothetical protein
MMNFLLPNVHTMKTQRVPCYRTVIVMSSFHNLLTSHKKVKFKYIINIILPLRPLLLEEKTKQKNIITIFLYFF